MARRFGSAVCRHRRPYLRIHCLTSRCSRTALRAAADRHGVRSVPMSGEYLNPYQPFIDDRKHISDLDGQRFVVLRMPPSVNGMWGQGRETVRHRLSTKTISYPARAHVTLCGFAARTELAAVQEVVRSWAQSTPSLLIELESASVFPPPFQIVMVQVRRKPELFAALTTLRRQADVRGLCLSTVVPPEQWIFHMSVALLFCARRFNLAGAHVLRRPDRGSIGPLCSRCC